MGYRSFRLLRWPLALVVLTVLTLAGCTPPTTDSDQVLRDLLAGRTWYNDESSPDTNPAEFFFYANGTFVADAASAAKTRNDRGVN